MAEKLNAIFKNVDEKDEANDYKLTAVANSPSEVLEINNPKLVDVQFSKRLKDLFGIKRFQADVLSNLDTHNAFFVYCDLVDLSRILLNGKKTTLLVSLTTAGNLSKKINYLASKQQNFRDASKSKSVNIVSFSVKNEDGELVDFCGQNFYFELEIAPSGDN